MKELGYALTVGKIQQNLTKSYVMSAWVNFKIVILKHLDGITVTVHAEATDEDIRNLKYMSSNIYDEDLDMRLFIDKRVYDRYDL